MNVTAAMTQRWWELPLLFLAAREEGAWAGEFAWLILKLLRQIGGVAQASDDTMFLFELLEEVQFIGSQNYPTEFHPI